METDKKALRHSSTHHHMVPAVSVSPGYTVPPMTRPKGYLQAWKQRRSCITDMGEDMLCTTDEAQELEGSRPSTAICRLYATAPEIK